MLALGHFLYSRIPPVENGPFRLDFFSTGFFWSFFLSSVESILQSHHQKHLVQPPRPTDTEKAVLRVEQKKRTLRAPSTEQYTARVPEAVNSQVPRAPILGESQVLLVPVTSTKQDNGNYSPLPGLLVKVVHFLCTTYLFRRGQLSKPFLNVLRHLARGLADRPTLFARSSPARWARAGGGVYRFKPFKAPPQFWGRTTWN